MKYRQHANQDRRNAQAAARQYGHAAARHFGRRSDCQTRTRPRTGFTLVELLIVVLIMGLFASVAQPRFSASLAKRQADLLARQISMDLETVRRVARATSTSKSMSFDKTNKTYTLTGIKNPDRASANYVVSLVDNFPLATFSTVNLGGDLVIIFNGFGIPDSGGSISVKVGSYTSTITVDSVTGSTSIL